MLPSNILLFLFKFLFQEAQIHEHSVLFNELFNSPVACRIHFYKGVFDIEKIILDIRKKFVPVRVGRLWHRMPREAVAASFLEVSRARMNRAWSHLGYWKMSLPLAGSGTGWTSRSLQTFCDSVKLNSFFWGIKVKSEPRSASERTGVGRARLFSPAESDLSWPLHGYFHLSGCFEYKWG